MKLADNHTQCHRLIVGANGGIGSAIAERWQQQLNTHTIAVSRKGDADLTETHVASSKVASPIQRWACDHSETQIQQVLREALIPDDVLDKIVIATGMLSAERGPEKSLQQCSQSHWEASMRINAWLPLLWLQQLEPQLKKQRTPCVIAVLSARVGSISDNRLGGWHSYRSSKAALNMLLKTISIEWTRTLPHVKLMAFHPGTTDTPLSKPFQKNVPDDKLFEPAWVAQQLDSLMDSVSLDGQCDYLDWAGKTIDW